ncbi:hypothetical protein TNCV_4815121 [Trichonephila clavipes]|nr:hypothetical protein TNCV_4815121 [Trichonephila clavipes]
MSASARARASQKYKSRLSLERGGYGPHTGTPMSGAERASETVSGTSQSRRRDSIKTYRHYGKRGASKLQKYIHWCEMHHNRRSEHDWMRCAT